jgi:hypothetical protein
VEEGGVEFLNYLLAKAVTPDSGSPDVSKVREWSFKDIMRMSPAQQKEWKMACKQELDSLRVQDVYDIVDPPPGRKIIKNRWVFNVKSDRRKKARLVAKGFSQVEGIDFDNIFSPVVRFETVCLMLALAVLENWNMLGVDVKTAFLYGELDEELYMEQPEGFKIKGQERKVLQLKRAIYGLKQAALQWWRALDKSMHKLGFKRLLSDSGLFIMKNASQEPEVIVIVYVDDAVFMGPNKSTVSKARDCFMKVWECHDLGEIKEYLHMNIEKCNGMISIDQCAYLHKVLKRFNMLNAKTAKTPLPMGYIPAPNTEPVDEELCHRFQQVIGSLLYIMLGTRPDIAFAVTKLSQHAANPSRDHLQKALYICRYLAGTQHYKLVYEGRKQLGIIAYTDSDWGSDPSMHRSTTSYLVKLASRVVCWNTRAQCTVALSSTEAEYMSLSDASRQLIWINLLFEELGIDL